ncbi:MAG TPA: type IV toxin-antitoxin system AbiEi family antitoxin domain-containing protein [Jiangellaceae bacterium]
MPYELDVADIASGQAGMFTAAQASAAGVPAQALNRLASRELVERIAHGVYRLTGTPAMPLDDLRAAWLATDPGVLAAERLTGEGIDVVVSHRSAARLHELGDLEADIHEFTSQTRRQSRRRDVRFHRGTVQDSDVTVVDGLPVTTIERTIEDLARAHVDGGHLASVVRDAILTSHVPPDTIAARLRPLAHHYGHPLGDGHGLVTTLLEQAGLPAAARDAVAMVDEQNRQRQLRETPPGSAQVNQALAQLFARNAEALRHAISSDDLRRLAAQVSMPALDVNRLFEQLAQSNTEQIQKMLGDESLRDYVRQAMRGSSGTEPADSRSGDAETGASDS